MYADDMQTKNLLNGMENLKISHTFTIAEPDAGGSFPVVKGQVCRAA